MHREQRVGFVGLGAMGIGMAANVQRLLRTEQLPGMSPTLLVHNRTRSRALPLTSDPGLGCQLADSVADVARSCGIICVMLIDDSACEAVLQQLLAATGDESCARPLAGGVVINHSTTSPTFAEAAERRIAAGGGTYIASPVWGRPDAAAAASLIVAPGCADAAAVQRVAPLLQAHGRLLPPLDSPTKACMFKLAGNFSLFGFVEVLCEALTLCDKSGIPRHAYLAFVDSFFACKPIQGYARRAAEEAFEGGVAVELALKDMRYVRELAEATRCPVPAADLVFNSLLAATANGHGRDDIGSILLMVQRAAGTGRLRQGPRADSAPQQQQQQGRASPLAAAGEL